MKSVYSQKEIDSRRKQTCLRFRPKDYTIVSSSSSIFVALGGVLAAEDGGSSEVP